MKLLGNGKLTANFDAECAATREILNLVGDNWSVLVVVLLGEGATRFSALKRALGSISQRMLTSTLRGLERDGLVKRTVYPTNPPQVEYALTRLGRTLIEPVTVLAVWAQGHRADGLPRTGGVRPREQAAGSSGSLIARSCDACPASSLSSMRSPPSTGAILPSDERPGGALRAVQQRVRREGKNDHRSIRTPTRALVEQRRARFTSSVAALRAALSAENGFEISAASLRL